MGGPLLPLLPVAVEWEQQGHQRTTMAVVLSLLVGVGVGLTTSARLEMAGDGCDDGYLDCSDRAELCRADNYSQLLQMMTHCRQTCRKFFEEKTVPDMVDVLGGLDNVIPDIFGEEIKICSLREGVDSLLRLSLLRHRLATLLQPPWVPAFTSRGWEIAEVPGRLMGMINIVRLNGIKMMEEEPCVAEAACFNCQKLLEDKRECSLPEHSGKQLILPMTNQLKDTILETLHPLAESWAGVRLLGTSVYGIRRYRAGSWLATHVDKLDTHVISAIINVSQTAPWPLFILDNAGSQHKVQLEPGQMLWYESAKLPHGRPHTFTGEYYDNIFVHFKPISRHWWRRGAISWDKGDTPPWRVKLETDSKGKKSIVKSLQ